MSRFEENTKALALAATLSAIIMWQSHAAAQATFDFSGLSKFHDGSPKSPLVTVNPPGTLFGIDFRPEGFVTLPAQQEFIYSRFPTDLEDSYVSQAFQAHGISALGRRIMLANTARRLKKVSMVLVTHATAGDYPAWSSLDPHGWAHPIQATFYTVTPGTNLLNYVTSTVTQAFIPWRPLVYPNGTEYPFSGKAFVVDFEFDGSVVLPQEVLMMVSFNTQSWGFAPTGVNGPYNKLNVGMVRAQPNVGSHPYTNEVLIIKSGTWLFPNISSDWVTTNMMFRITAETEPDDGFRPDPPTDVGTYDVRARTIGTNPIVEATEVFTILPVPVYPGYALSTAHETPVSVSLSKLLSKAPASGDATITVTDAGPNSAQGGIVELQAGAVLYTPPLGFSGNDTFLITLSYSNGATIQGVVTVTVGPGPEDGGQGMNPPQLDITTIPKLHVGIRFQGIPGRQYEIQRSPDMLEGSWQTIATAIAQTDGLVSHTDEEPLPQNGFYRLRRLNTTPE